jgi:hypothetical protein
VCCEKAAYFAVVCFHNYRCAVMVKIQNVYKVLTLILFIATFYSIVKYQNSISIDKCADGMKKSWTLMMQKQKTNESEKSAAVKIDKKFHSIFEKSIRVENILRSSHEPKDGENIFYIESSRVKLNEAYNNLTVRAACSIESALRTNPHMNVYLIMVTKDKNVELDMTKHLHALLSYSNFNILMSRFFEFGLHTPYEEFLLSLDINNMRYPTEHMSDIFRLLLLWKYGGTYLGAGHVSDGFFNAFRGCLFPIFPIHFIEKF